MKLGAALAALPLVSPSASTSAKNTLPTTFRLRRSLQDDEKCAREGQRAQECGAGQSSRKMCCSDEGLVCSAEEDSVRCVEGENPPEPTEGENTPEPTEAPPTSPPINRIPTQRPTAKAAGMTQPRTWTTILTKDKLVRNVMKQENKFMKRAITNERDPFRFTEEPSAMPSSTPSDVPTAEPSVSPSDVPTTTPSFAPTYSPTKERRDDCKVEMYYEKSWCWHDDARNSDCKENYQFCIDKSGDELLMEDCGGAEFKVIGFTVRPKSDSKRCWTRRGDAGIRLDDCDEKGDGKWKDQQWDGVCQKNPHMITPLGDKKWCLTQGHEPRDGERLKLQECDK